LLIDTFLVDATCPLQAARRENLHNKAAEATKIKEQNTDVRETFRYR
jgi:hypothetical protein